MTHRLQFGIKTTQYAAYEDILRVWQEADALPSIDHAWLFDHPMPIFQTPRNVPCLDGWTLLTALAAQTKRIRLGLMVTSNANQTPPLLAKRAATVDVISGGRLEFGIGAGGGAPDEQTAYGIEIYPPAERIQRLGEACEIIRRMWSQPVSDFDGRFYHLRDIYCEPKPIQKLPPFVMGVTGEQLGLRVVAKYADVWNFPGYPHGTTDDFQHKSQVIDRYCAEIGRSPDEIIRSAQLIIDPRESPAVTRGIVQSFIDAGATHLVLGMRGLDAGIARWLNDEIIDPLRAANEARG